MGKKWVVAVPVLAVLGLVVVLGRGFTGRATGGEVDQGGGCGPADEGASAQVGKQESAMMVNNPGGTPPVAQQLPPYGNGHGCSSNSDCSSGVCGELDYYDTNTQVTSVTHKCVQPCSDSNSCPAGFQYCYPVQTVSGNSRVPSRCCITGKEPSCRNQDGSVGYISQSCTPPVCVDQTSANALTLYNSNTAVVNYCLWSSASYWCQDFYTSKWCTNALNETTWDNTNCNWTGWNNAGTAFCGTNYPGYTAGWEWGQNHSHCN